MILKYIFNVILLWLINVCKFFWFLFKILFYNLKKILVIVTNIDDSGSIDEQMRTNLNEQDSSGKIKDKLSKNVLIFNLKSKFVILYYLKTRVQKYYIF